jgi:hypothetical protein
MTPIQTPVPPIESMTNLTSSLETLHIISPKPEALPIPLWLLDDLYEDLPPNPPNSPIHFPMEILHPTTTGTLQYLDIWFMSSEPSQSHCVIPPTFSSPKDKHMVTVTDITLLGPLYSRQFHCDEDILEEIVGAQKCPILIHLSLHHSSHFITPLTFHDIISINILGFHLIVLHFIHFSI